MTGYAKLFHIEGRKGITRLNAAPVKKQPNQTTVRLRFQFMGASELHRIPQAICRQKRLYI